MGIKGLMKLLSDNAPKSMKEQKFESYFGRKIAIDASMSIYQFLIVVGRSGMETLTNEAGEVTSHLQGMFSRTIRLLEAGLKPVYVFDGQPPDLKKEELAKRSTKRADAAEDLAAAIESGVKEDIEKFSKRTVKGGAWQGYRGEGLDWKDLIFRVERTLHSRLRTELEVFFGGENWGGPVPDFRLKGSPFHRSCIIYRGNSIAAQTSAMYKLGKPIVGRRKFRLTIYPGIDHSFVVALLVIFFDGKN